MDELMVQAEPTPEIESAAVPKLKEKLASRLKARGLRTEVHMLEPGTLERTEFKARRVIDKRNL
jgi:phenylacetate-CoA ligase